MKEYLNEQVEIARKREAFEDAVKRQLRTDERMQAYFKQFAPDSVEAFIEAYAENKSGWYQYVENYWYQTENKQSEAYDLSKGALNEIARKKVFDQMCRWLNREVAFDGIEVAPDWDYWLRNPLYFPAAEPVTLEEVEAHIAYIQQLPEDVEYWDFTFHSSHTPRYLDDENNDLNNPDGSETDDEEHYGRWFRYYDNIFHAPNGLRVSLDRINKEDYYRAIAKKKETEKNPSPAVNPSDWPPYLDYEKQLELQDRYVAQYESYENKIAFEGWRWSQSTSRFTEMIESTIYNLEDLEEFVPVTPNDDWREGLNVALEMYKRGKVVDALPAVYEEYLILLHNDLGFDDWLPADGNKNEEPIWIQSYKAEILEGRRILNEPADFNY